MNLISRAKITERTTSLMSDVLGKEMIENGIRVATDLQTAFRKAAKAYRACEQAGQLSQLFYSQRT